MPHPSRAYALLMSRPPLFLVAPLFALLSGCVIGELEEYELGDGVLVAPPPYDTEENGPVYNTPIVVRIALDDERPVIFHWAKLFFGDEQRTSDWLNENGWQEAALEAGETWRFETGCEGVQTDGGRPGGTGDIPVMYFEVDC